VIRHVAVPFFLQFWAREKGVAIFPRLLYVKKCPSEKAFLSFHFSGKEVKGDHEKMGNHLDWADLRFFGDRISLGAGEGQTGRTSQTGSASQTSGAS
jgi:hypothetical protein